MQKWGCASALSVAGQLLPPPGLESWLPSPSEGGPNGRSWRNLFFCLGATPDGAQDLLLTVLRGHSWETIHSSGDGTWVGCMQGKCLPGCPISQAPERRGTVTTTTTTPCPPESIAQLAPEHSGRSLQIPQAPPHRCTGPRWTDSPGNGTEACQLLQGRRARIGLHTAQARCWASTLTPGTAPHGPVTTQRHYC